METTIANGIATVRRSSPEVKYLGCEKPRLRNDRPSGAKPGVGDVTRLTLAQVSERSGLNIGYLSQIENDKAVPSLDALVAIAAALDVPVAWLVLDSTPAPRIVRAGDRPTMPPSRAPT